MNTIFQIQKTWPSAGLPFISFFLDFLILILKKEKEYKNEFFSGLKCRRRSVWFSAEERRPMDDGWLLPYGPPGGPLFGRPSDFDQPFVKL